MNLPGGPRKWAGLRAFALAAALLAPTVARAEVGEALRDSATAIAVQVTKGKPEGGVRTIRVRRGESIILRVRSDEELTVHVHGYDARLDVRPGSTATLRLMAQYQGRFPVGAHVKPAAPGKHGPEPTLLYLEVYPE
jgi:hypothetical protein